MQRQSDKTADEETDRFNRILRTHVTEDSEDERLLSEYMATTNHYDSESGSEDMSEPG